jgi:hypothetical protein
MDSTDHILTARMVNGLVREAELEALVAGPLIAAQQAYLFGDAFTHELFKG